MNLAARIHAFAKLGQWLSDRITSPPAENDSSDLFYHTIKRAGRSNPWFTPREIIRAFTYWSRVLTTANLTKWTAPYTLTNRTGKTENILVVTAGNLPLVGFHDLLCVLISGHRAIIDYSSRDAILIPLLLDKLTEFEAGYDPMIRSAGQNNDPLTGIIASGGNQAAAYFQSHYRNLPSIIRKNRSSAALLTGHESSSDLLGLADDMLTYFGLGCRNVSKIFYPDPLSLESLPALIQSSTVTDTVAAFEDNLRYQRARLSLHHEPFTDTGRLLLKPDAGIHAPIGVVYLEPYSSLSAVIRRIKSLRSELQCLVEDQPHFDFSVPFGQSQYPQLWDWADGINTLSFLSDITSSSP